MAKKKQEKEEKKVNLDGVVGLVGSTTEQAVSETLEGKLPQKKLCTGAAQGYSSYTEQALFSSDSS